MTDDLVKRLRDGVPCCDPDAGNGEGSFYIDDANETMCEAADRIEALTAENERLRKDRDATLDALFDAIALIGHAMPMETTALIGGERMVAKNVWQKGHDIMFPRARAALGDTQ